MAWAKQNQGTMDMKWLARRRRVAPAWVAFGLILSVLFVMLVSGIANRNAKRGSSQALPHLSAVKAPTKLPAAVRVASVAATPRLAAAVAPAKLTGFFVAPDGTPGGNGSRERPWDLRTALGHPARVRPGSTIWMRGGTYQGRFTGKLRGTRSAPITVRGYPGERPILDGAGRDGAGQGADGAEADDAPTDHAAEDAATQGAEDSETQGATPNGQGRRNGQGRKKGRGRKNGQVAGNGQAAGNGQGGKGARSGKNILTIRGTATIYRDFEVTNSNPNRSRKGGTGVMVYGPETKLINLIVHDAADSGIGFWAPAVDAEIYGCIIYNNGYQEPDRGHGHAIYTQNLTGTKHIVDNIMFNQFGYGLHAYNTNASLKGYHIEGNVCFNNGSVSQRGYTTDLLIGGRNPASAITLLNNYTYNNHPAALSVSLGYMAVNSDIKVQNNYFAGGTRLKKWQTATVTGNTFVGSNAMIHLQMAPDISLSSYKWDNNSYFAKGAAPFKFKAKSCDFAEWKSDTGLDRSSQYVNGYPRETSVFLRPNRYERGRAHIIVYNWNGQSAVEVDARSLLAVGQRYEVRNVENYFGSVVLSGTYSGKPLRLPMSGLSIAQPAGGSQRRAVPSGPEFNTFVLIPR